MPTPAALRRLVVTLLPFAVAAGCIQGTSIGHDDRSPLADDPTVVLLDDDALVGVASAAAEAAPADGQRAAGGAEEAGDAEETVAPPRTQARPEWLGTIPLPPAPSDGSPLPTPPELIDRRLPPPPAALPPPPTDAYAADIGPVPPDVVARSTWKPECPIALDDLRYVRVTHWGFDGEVHTGELIVHATAAEGIAEVFGRLHAARFPIEELRVISMDDMTALSTGDGNVSSAFVCRRKVSGRSWSEHSYGLALDLNPFHNPYLSGSLVVPGLAGSYLDRADVRPGMIVAGDEVVHAFADIGWRWGGDWNEQKDWMHFSANGK